MGGEWKHSCHQVFWQQRILCGMCVGTIIYKNIACKSCNIWKSSEMKSWTTAHSRSILLAWLLVALEHCFLLEQPTGSMFKWFPQWRFFTKYIGVVTWWCKWKLATSNVRISPKKTSQIISIIWNTITKTYGASHNAKDWTNVCRSPYLPGCLRYTAKRCGWGSGVRPAWRLHTSGAIPNMSVNYPWDNWPRTGYHYGEWSCNSNARFATFKLPQFYMLNLLGHVLGYCPKLPMSKDHQRSTQASPHWRTNVKERFAWQSPT